MSKTVDKRVVEMQFNNQDFERNVQTSLSTLDNLNKQLKDLEGAKGLEDLGAAAKNLDLGDAAKQVDDMSGGFSKLEQIGIGALREIGGELAKFGLSITDKVLKPLKEVMNAFTELTTIPLDTMGEGFTKFKEKTGSVGTLISQGYDMDLVTEQLEKLNFFTDETSYNFTDMVNEIGKFTAAGQELDDSVEAMMGIANWAALSGQNATKASQAMYQLSQAMGKGALKLDDYKSIQNANMDTQEFRKNAIEAAKAIGTIREAANGMYEVISTGKTFTFQEMFTSDALTKGMWLSSDVMMKTFKKYSSAVDELYEAVQSGQYETASEAIEAMSGSLDEFGLKAFKAAQEARSWSDVVDSLKDAASTSWMNIFELIFGNYEEAKDLFTDMANNFYDVLVTPIQNIGEIFEQWNSLGGRDVWWESFWTFLENVGKLFEPIKEAWNETFGAFDAEALGDKLYILTLKFKDFAESIGWTEESAETLKGIFKGIFGILKLAMQGLKNLWTIMQPFIRIAGRILSFVGKLAGSLGNLISEITGITTSGKGLVTVGEKIETVFYALGEPLAQFTKNMRDIFDSSWVNKESGIFNVFNTLHESLKAIVALVIDTASALTGIDFSKFEGKVLGVMDYIRDEIRLKIAEIREFFGGIFEKFDLSGNLFTDVKRFFTDAQFRSQFVEIGLNIVQGLVNGIRDAASSMIPQCIKDLFNTVVGWFKNLFGIHSPSTVFAALGGLLMAGLAQGVKTGLADYVKPIIHYVIDNIVAFFKAPDLLGRLQNIGRDILAGIGQGLQNGYNFLPTIAAVVQQIVGKFKELLGIRSPSKVMEDEVGKQIPAGIAKGMSDGMGSLGYLIKIIQNWVSGLSKALEPLKPAFKMLLEAVNAVATAILQIVIDISKIFKESGIGNAMVRYFKNLAKDSEKSAQFVRKLVTLIAIFATMRGLIKGLNAITGVADKAVGIFEKFGELAEGVKDLTKAMKTDIKLRLVKDFVRDLGIAIALVAGAIYILGKMNEQELYKGATKVAIIAGVIGVIVVAIQLIASKTQYGIRALESMDKFSKTFIAIGGSIFLVAMAIKKLASIDYSSMNQAKRTLAGIGSFFLIYTVAIMTLESVLPGNNSDDVWKLLLSAAGSVYLIAMAINKIAKVPEDGFDRAMIAIFGIQLITMAMVTFVVLASKLKEGQVAMKLTGLAAAILAVGVCVNLIATAARHFGALSQNASQFIAGLGAVVVIIGMLILVMREASKMNKAYKSLLSMAALFAAMGLVVKVIGEMDPKDAAKGYFALVALSALILGMTAVIGVINQYFGSEEVVDAAKTLLGAAAAIAILGLVVRMLGTISLPEIKKAVAVVAALSVLMALLIAVTGWSNGQGGVLESSASGSWKKGKKGFHTSSQKSNGASVKQLIATALSIMALAYTVVKLSSIPENELKRATRVVEKIGAIVMVMMYVMSRIAQNENVKIGTIISLTAAIAVITGSLILLAQFNDEIPAMLAGAFGIALIMAAIGFAMKQVASVGEEGQKSMKQVVAIIVTMAVIAGMMFVLALNSKDIDWGVIAAFGLGLAAIMLSIGAALKLADGVKTKTAGTILLATLALIPVGAALVALGYFVKGEDWVSIAVGALAMAGVVAVLGLILKFSGDLKVTNAAALLVASLALVPIGIALAVVAKQDWASILAAMGAVSLTILAVSFAMTILGSLSIGQALTGLLGMAAVAGGILATGYALSMVAQYDWENILSAMGAIILTMTVATVLVAVLGALGEGGGIAIIGALLMAAIAAELLLVGMSLSIVAQNDWQSIQQSMYAMMAVIGVAVAAAALLGGLAYAAGASIIGVVLLGAIAVEMLVFAAALEVGAIACQTFLAAVSEFFVQERAQAILDFFSTLGDGIPVVAAKISEGIQMAILIFQTAAPLIEASMKQLVNTIADGLVEMAKVIGDRGVDVVNAIADMIDKIKATVQERFGIASPSKWFAEIGGFLMLGLAQGIKDKMSSPIKTICDMGRSLIEHFKNVVGVHSKSVIFKAIGGFCVAGLTSGIFDNLGSVFGAGDAMGSSLTDGFMSGAGGLLSGDVAKQIGEQLGIDLGENFKISDLSGLGDALKNLDVSKLDLSSMSDLDIQSFVDQLKEAGVDASDLDETLTNIQNKDNTIEFKAELDTETLKKETEKVMNGAYGNGLDRWKKMYQEYLKAYNGDVAKALDAVTKVQNEVNKGLGNTLVHNMDEMGKKLGLTAEEIKKAKESAGKTTEESKPGRDFKKDAHKAVTDTSKADAEKAAAEQMKRNMPYETAMAALEHDITGQKKKQVEEVQKQKLANEHNYSLAEKEDAMKKQAENRSLMASSTLTDAQRQQLEAENKKYQKVIDTYNAQQDVTEAIRQQTEATKQAEAVEKSRAEQAKKQREEAAKAAATNRDFTKDAHKAVTSITKDQAAAAAQEQMMRNMPTANAKKAAQNVPTKVQTETIKTETKAETNVKVEVKSVDASAVNKEVVKEVEKQCQGTTAKCVITPKVDVRDANRNIEDFKKKTDDLAQSVPKSFSGIAETIKSFMTNIATSVKSKAPEVESSVKAAFVTSINNAATQLSSADLINKFTTAGMNAANGFIKGMKSKNKDVAAAATAMGKMAATATKNALKEKSPSRIMTEIGVYAGEGLSNGMLSTLDLLTKTGGAMGEATIESVGQQLNNLQSVLDNNNIDYNPIIRPVVDTSNIQYAMSGIDNIIGQNRVSNIAANVNMSNSYNDAQLMAMQSRMDAFQGTLNDVVELLNKPQQPTPVQVSLEGDTNKFFRAMVGEDTRYAKMHGNSAFAHG